MKLFSVWVELQLADCFDIHNHALQQLKDNQLTFVSLSTWKRWKSKGKEENEVFIEAINGDNNQLDS